MITLNTYRNAIDLDKPFYKSLSIVDKSDRNKLVNSILDWLTEGRFNPEAEYTEKRKLIQSLLTSLSPERFIPGDIHEFIDALLELERSDEVSIDARAISTISLNASHKTHYALWNGDITRLKIDAIVNAANEQMLGCFQPFHKCIDNAIHCGAGPRLREDCYKIMQLQGYRESTGNAKITRSYHLPSKFVLHTVGPIVSNKTPSDHHRDLLQNSYRACLQLAKESGLARSVAFCSISTGVFGYPIQQAASVALRTVSDWVSENPDALDLIVFNVFSDSDELVYKELIQHAK